VDVLRYVVVYNLIVFFFQAEDGIRDRTVTGVQTCALPILSAERRKEQQWHLARKSKNAQQYGGMRQLVDQPLLRGRLHPRPDKRYKLSRDEELEVAMLQGAEARGNTLAKARG